MSRFDELFDRYYVPLVRKLRRLVRNPEDARDLAQDVLFKTWQRLDGIAPEAEWSYLNVAAD